MTDFCFISDIHNEDVVLDINVFENTEDTVLLIVGDFYVARKWDKLTKLIAPYSEAFKEVIYILGNHEHWDGSFVRDMYWYKNALKGFDNVTVMEKDCVVFDNVAVIGATLWTDYNKLCPLTTLDARRNMKDYRKIRNGTMVEPFKDPFRPYDAYVDHTMAVYYIEEEITKQKALGRDIIVMTHHAPTLVSLDPNRGNDPLNPCYATDLSELILDTNPDYWLHGHVHQSNDYMVGDTRVMSNPKGYDSYDRNVDFDPNIRITFNK